MLSTIWSYRSRRQLHIETGLVGSFWKKRYHDCKVRDERELVERLRYLHAIP
jgi:hypothetical protein